MIIAELCEFGPISFSVTASSSLIKYLRDIFPISGDVPPDIDFFIATGEANDNIVQNKFNELISINNNKIFKFENDRSKFLIHMGARISVYAEMKKSRRMNTAIHFPHIAQKWSNKAYLSASELFYGHVVYSVILWIVFVCAVRNRKTILHASAFSDSQKTFALSGRGGVGKTSLSGWALLQGGYNFISDDLLPVAAGCAFRTGLFVHIYPYNGFSDRLWLGRAKIFSLNHLHWHFWRMWKGAKGACRRHLPSAIYGKTMDDSCKQPLAALVWLCPTQSAESAIEVATLEEFATDHLSVLEEEMRYAFDFFDSLPENLEQGILGRRFRDAVIDGIHEAVRNAKIFRFRISKNEPIAQNGKKLKNALSKLHG